MNYIENSEMINEDFITCFSDIKNIDSHKNSSSKMSSIESALSDHLNLFRVGIINKEFNEDHIKKIAKLLEKEKLVKYFPSLANSIEELFAIIGSC